MSNENVTRWNRREKQLTNPNPPSARQIIADERKNAFDRHSEKRGVSAIDDARSEMSLAERLSKRGQDKIAEKKNRFGDPMTQTVDARDKFESTAGKRTVETEWRGKSVARSATGRPLDAELIELKKASDANRAARVEAKKREALGIPEEKAHLTGEEIQALCLFLAAAHTEWPLDERRGPNDGSEADQRYRAAVIHNAHQLRKMWDWLLLNNLAKLSLAGMLLAFDQLKQGGFLDDGRAKKRGFGNDELINVVAEPPQSPLSEALGAKSQNAVDEVFALVKSGRARLERQRPATSEESQEIVAARKMNFNDLKHQVQQNYRKGN